MVINTFAEEYKIKTSFLVWDTKIRFGVRLLLYLPNFYEHTWRLPRSHLIMGLTVFSPHLAKTWKRGDLQTPKCSNLCINHFK